MLLTELDHSLPEAQQSRISLDTAPVKPADLIVLAIGVVVALLRIPNLIAGNEHRHSAGQEQNRCKVTNLPLPQVFNSGIVRHTLHSAVPAQILIRAIVVALTIRL